MSGSIGGPEEPPWSAASSLAGYIVHPCDQAVGIVVILLGLGPVGIIHALLGLLVDYKAEYFVCYVGKR